MMVIAFLLGLTGSVGHCAGMCSGMAFMWGRATAVTPTRLFLLHLGRTTTYALLGLLAGGLGWIVSGGSGGGHAHHASAAAAPPPFLAGLQGGLALATAVIAAYMALAVLGKVPSPELAFAGLTRRWGGWMRRARRAHLGSSGLAGGIRPYLLGLLWGLLPCGLVLTALLTAAAGGSPGRGALAMLAFGLGTWPLLGAVSLAGGREWPPGAHRAWLRPVTALLVLLFGLQMGLRGLAAWGLVAHLHLGQVMIW